MGPQDDSEKRPIDGWAKLHQQELQVQDPQHGGQAARIYPDDIALVYVDDQLIWEATEVYERTHIRIQTPFRSDPEYACEFEIAEDLCAVTLTVDSKKEGSFFELPDTEPALNTQIKVLEVPAPLSAFGEEIGSDIYAELLERKIKNGILPDQIREAIEHPGTPVVVVKSPSPKMGINRLNNRFALPQPTPGDWKGFTLSYPVLRPCKTGEVLITREIQPSQAGISVFGEPVVPPQITPPQLQAQDGSVEVSPDQNQALARLEGYPQLLGQQVCVLPFEHNTQDLKGGPGQIYDLKGSLQVQGQVQEGAQVWAQQHIEIQGNVNHAQLESRGCVIVHGNCVRAQIYTGGDAAACLRLLSPVQELIRDIRALARMLAEVLDAARHGIPSERKILQRLIQTQFPQFLEQIEALWQLNKSLHQLHPRRTMVLKVVLSNLMNLNERQVNQRIFQDWLERLEEFAEDLQNRSEQSADAYIAYAHNSDLVASGNLYILAEGCYNSSLRAGGDIYFCGTPGYCREGYIELGGNLYARELGSPNGSRLQVQLSATGRIQAEVIHPGVEFRFGQSPWEHSLQRQAQREILLHRGKIVNRPQTEPMEEDIFSASRPK